MPDRGAPPAPAERPARAPRAPRSERGAVTLWLLGLCVVLLFVGGLSLDLWRALAERQGLARAADAAVAGAAAELDEEAFRAEGVVRLDPTAAKARAQEQAHALASAEEVRVVSVDADPHRIRLRLGTEVDLTLLRLLRPTEGPWPVEVEASAVPEPRGSTPTR